MFAAIVNVPGYLPMDDELTTFSTAREAWQYLVSEVDRSWDEYPEDENGACIEAHTAMHNQDQDQPGTIYAPTPGYEGSHDLGLAYSVIEVTVTVEEVTHHGTYRNRRTVELSDYSAESVGRMLAAGPYAAHATPAQVEKVAEELESNGTAELGWVTWTVVQ